MQDPFVLKVSKYYKISYKDAEHLYVNNPNDFYNKLKTLF